MGEHFLLQRHGKYLRERKHAVYSALLISGKLGSYLRDIDRQAEAMFSRLVAQMAAQEGVTEQLKAENQILWVQHMNAVRETVTEIINHDLIYA